MTPTLLFVAVPSRDVTSAWDKGANGKLRAFDRDSGDMVWESPAFDKVTGAPMTFAHQGRQYILLPVQGADRVGKLIAAALPVDPAEKAGSS